ncbi:MAG TPA: dihydroorotase, partial [Flavobacteriaceae bacterium]|nr:dihydroorotase [Flavobacteriaceae bacterium]
LQYTQSFNGLTIAFSNDENISKNGVANEEVAATKLGLKGIPALAEELQIARNIFLLEYTGGKLHIPTISTEKSVTLIREAKKKGLAISCSVSINNLLLNDEALESYNSNLKLLPPLRTKRDQKALLKGLKDGTIDGVTSDHNPIDVEHKKMEFDHAMFGSIGLESCFGALRSVVSTTEAVTFLTRLKNTFGISNTPIAEGSKANITLFNPDFEWTFTENEIVSSSKNAALLGKKLKGKAYGIYVNKKLIINT